FGITDDEFRRAIDRFEAASVQRQEQKNTAQDVFFVEQIVSHHLAGGHLMSPDQQFVVEAGILDRLNKQDLEQALAERTAVAPIVLVVGPDDLSASVPNADRILRIVAEVEDAVVVARDADDEGIDTLMATPQPAEVLSRSKDPSYEYTTLTYPNGATVYLWPSDIAESGVFMLAESFGGTSLVAIEDLPEISLISDVLARSGVGPADAPTLQRLLSDRLVDVFPWMTETREGLTGSAATADVETMFQLVHLYLTAPRFDPVAVDAVLAEVATLNQDRADIPDIRFDEALNEGYYSGDPRYFVLPTDEQLSDFDVEAMDRVYRERYGNAGDFAFAFVGDFSIAEMTDLASRYIGTLPGNSELETWVDNQPLPPREIQVIPFEAGADPQGQIGLFFTNEFQPVLADRVTAQLLQLIVDARLRDRIREGLSATYSIRSGIDLQRDPDPFAEAFVISTGNPQDLGRISEEVMADLVDLQVNGPTDRQFETAREQLRTEMDLIDNLTLAEALTTAFLYPDQPVSDLTRRHLIVDTITSRDVRDLARVVFNPNQRIEVRQGPGS
ncbi:MAG: insulinase family protein, partial [Acidimicrobiia bacterium]